jgi:hypothetical protein
MVLNGRRRHFARHSGSRKPPVANAISRASVAGIAGPNNAPNRVRVMAPVSASAFMNRFGAIGLLLLVLSLWLGATRCATAAESYDNCAGFITSLPATITTQGTWCLKQDLTTAITSGYAVTISANNVTLDCNGYKIGGLAAGLGTATMGVYSGGLNVNLRRCNIRGFYFGAYFNGSGHVIEDNRFDNNTFTAIDIEGDGSIARRNRIFDTGGTTSGHYAYGIFAVFAVDILDNTISGVVSTPGGNGDAYGIATTADSGGTIRNNRIRGLVSAGTGSSKGIYHLYQSDRLSMRDNNLIGDGSPNSVGIFCSNPNGGDRTIDNSIGGFGTAISFCNNSHGNLVTP